jgi:hypothetical protein
MIRITIAALALVALAACENAAPPAITADERVAAEYPDLAAIYGGDRGIYRGCGPNSGVCHNGPEFPNLRSLAALVDQIGVPCNEKRTEPGEIHDWCERPGDVAVVAGRAIEIGWAEPMAPAAEGDVPRSWRLHVRDLGPTETDPATVPVVRFLPRSTGPAFVHFDLLEEGAATSVRRVAPDVVEIQIPAPDVDAADGREAGRMLAEELEGAGVPGDPDAIQLGDPNRDGVFGRDLGAALIVPGAPERSYLMRRLMDPTFGTLMPLANCCFWTRDALRATWCWIAGLDEDGGNALEPIDYAACPPMPPEYDRLVYPEQGPMCETSGMCPVRAVDPTEEPSFGAVIGLVRASCAGAACHVGGPADLRFRIPMDDAAAYDAILAQVVPGDPMASPLYRRISPDLCMLPDCAPMPLGRPPLAERDRAIVRAWIEEGAPR